MPPVAEALAHYLRHGRPADTPTRHLFVPLKMPLEAFVGSSAIRHIVVKHAKIAGIDAPFLGSHVLRHSHAARQIDLGARPQVVSELLGHRDPGRFPPMCASPRRHCARSRCRCRHDDRRDLVRAEVRRGELPGVQARHGPSLSTRCVRDRATPSLRRRAVGR
ncbi:hypothetical protein A4U53_004080 (plasmid) [Rhizobium ruizarguesonis]|uniref:Uncharacterized protein n=1 Tax=Rhizobium ruizarguesonis TaxID=2081791 RepID=A0ACD5EGK3_9HYPH